MGAGVSQGLRKYSNVKSTASYDKCGFDRIWYFSSRAAVCQVLAAGGPMKRAVREAGLPASAQHCSSLCSCWCLKLCCVTFISKQRATGL